MMVLVIYTNAMRPNRQETSREGRRNDVEYIPAHIRAEMHSTAGATARDPYSPR
jgi:hypothetical protein